MKSRITILALTAAFLGAVTAGCGDLSSVAEGTTDIESATEQSVAERDEAPVSSGGDSDSDAVSDDVDIDATVVADDTSDEESVDSIADATTDPYDPSGSTVALTEAEADGILFMREEEKLARDVYLTLFDVWGLRVFENIAASEAHHTESVLGLIEQFGLDDPVVDDAVGAFTNPDFAALYDELVALGSESLVDALTVGALIEDLDIADLRAWLASTDNPSIVRVYGNLLKGSENHMRAFVGQLEGQGATYEPTYLTSDDVTEILAAEQGNGGQGGGGRGRGGHNH